MRSVVPEFEVVGRVVVSAARSTRGRRAAVLDPMTPHDGEGAGAVGDRVVDAMQNALTRLTEHRRLIVG